MTVKIEHENCAYSYGDETGGLEPAEKRIMDLSVDLIQGLYDLGLEYNKEELVAAIHTIQHFVMISVLHRHYPAYWSQWFKEPTESDGASRNV